MVFTFFISEIFYVKIVISLCLIYYFSINFIILINLFVESILTYKKGKDNIKIIIFDSFSQHKEKEGKGLLGLDCYTSPTSHNIFFSFILMDKFLTLKKF